jgi:hypothetical protein
MNIIDDQAPVPTCYHMAPSLPRSKKVDSRARNGKFESSSLQRRVRCEPRGRGAPYKLMTLDVGEFIRRFLIHVLPDGFHRIRHYGLFANGNRAGNIALAHRLLGVPDPPPSSADSDGTQSRHEDNEWNACPCCGGRIIIIETFEPGCQPRLWPIPSIGFASS